MQQKHNPLKLILEIIKVLKCVGCSLGGKIRNPQASAWRHCQVFLKSPFGEEPRRGLIWLGSSFLLFICPPEGVILGKRLWLPGQSSGGPIGHKVYMQLFSLSWNCPVHPLCPGGLTACARSTTRHSVFTSDENPGPADHFSIFRFALLVLPVQQCGVNRLDYGLMQAYWSLLGPKGRLCLENSVCLASSWKHKSLSFLSRFFFMWNDDQYFQLFGWSPILLHSAWCVLQEAPRRRLMGILGLSAHSGITVFLQEAIGIAWQQIMRATSLWRAPRMIWRTGWSPSAESYGDLLEEVSIFKITEKQKAKPVYLSPPADVPTSSYFQMDDC